ncbi:MAG: Gfo/Idh/MocA family oxidoreductase [Bacteroidales bacterium]|nr:Gfo/Idh/MocA family oxidoreductase [Bacteroidales bacterium]
MLKIGVIGAGHLGKIHINCIKQIPDFELVGFFDTNPDIVSNVKNEFGIMPFETFEELIKAVDVVDIVTPTFAHYEYAAYALKRFKHVFIEKPIVATPGEALQLMDIAHEANVKVQVGHVERFNPAFLAAMPYFQNPMFIESHRLSGFNARGTDVPVILDLMIHDIDIILTVVKANIRKISASGVAVLSDSADIASARLEFDNGCVANLTASRISLRTMRKSRFFQRDAYISVDYLNKETEIVRIKELNGNTPEPGFPVIDPGNGKEARQLFFERPLITPINAIQTELSSFAEAILGNTAPPVTIMDGYQALQVSHQILEKVNYSLGRLQA